VFKRLVRLERSLEKELELDIANLKPRGTEIIPLFQDYGLARPEGGPRRIRTHLPDRVILLQALTLQMAYPLPPEKLDLEEAVKELYKTLEDRLANRGRLYYAGAKVCWDGAQENFAHPEKSRAEDLGSPVPPRARLLPLRRKDSGSDPRAGALGNTHELKGMGAAFPAAPLFRMADASLREDP